jgi:hypothetical protein
MPKLDAYGKPLPDGTAEDGSTTPPTDDPTGDGSGTGGIKTPPPAPAPPPPAPAPPAGTQAPTPISAPADTGGIKPPGGISTSPIPSGPPQTIQDAYQQSIMALLNRPSPEQAAANVAQSPQAAAYRNAEQRQLAASRAQNAEQAGQNGLAGTGAFDSQTQGLKQASGERIAGFEANLADKAMTDRRAELMQGLQMAQSTGQFEQAQALQRELAATDAKLKERGLDLQQTGQENQFALGNAQNANTAQSIANQLHLGMGDLDLRKLLGMLQNQTTRYGIDVGANTAAGQLGLGYAGLNQNADQYYNSSMLGLLNGGA